MKVLFAGTPDFAVPSLIAIAACHEVIGVLTAPDTQKGRGRSVLFSDVKKTALERGIQVFQPAVLGKSFYDIIRTLSPELLVCVAFGKIFRKTFLECFPRGGINVHPSLLPKYRGPSPVTAAILSGDSVTGVTVQKLALAMDSGDILAQEKYLLSGKETGESLLETLSQEGAKILVSVLKDMETGKDQATPQDEKTATYCGLVKKDDGQISWKESASTLERMVRAYDLWPGVSTLYKGKRLYFRKAAVFGHDMPSSMEKLNETAKLHEKLPGRVLGVDKDHGILINTTEGILSVSMLQLEFKKTLDWRSFINGNSTILEYTFGGTNAGF
ncbi:MAG: methionyl-tRNA formyltransferase [Spirochaetaceae bacterium]|nr:MAG: methionyl-tRNA formyltransferase [Spirochaetaceae bacterium]